MRSEDKVIKGAYEQSLWNNIPSEAKLIFSTKFQLNWQFLIELVAMIYLANLTNKLALNSTAVFSS